MSDTENWQVAFAALKSQYKLSDDAIGAFALQLRFNLDDLKELAAECIVGGGDDKSCDILYFDREAEVVVIAQCYLAQNPKPGDVPPSKKADDLNTAITWVFNTPIDKVPDGLRDRANEIREALKSDSVRQIHVWYCHNLKESKNVRDALEAVEHGLKAAIKAYDKSGNVQIFTKEVGTGEFDLLYTQAARAIMVTDTFSVDVEGYVRSSGPKWEALTTFVPGSWLANLFETYKADLFSSNIRGYLGSRSSDANINNGIKNTAAHEAENFAIYNNGVTALTFDFKPAALESGKARLDIVGISIVNGAQTTGSIASVKEALPDAVNVPIRFIRSDSEDIIENIVRFNNSQNKIEAADFRSNDSTQQRLREEFDKIDDAEYEGGRRGGVSDAIKRSRFTLPSYTVAQCLAAFHGDPVAAYDRKSALWSDDKAYSQIFNERTSARHIVFVYSLLQAINNRRLSLVSKSKSGEDLTEIEKAILSYLNKKGAPFLTVYGLSAIIETILGKAIPNKFDLKFSSASLAPNVGADIWESILDIILPLASASLEGAFSSGRIQGEGVQTAMPNFRALVASVAGVHKENFQNFAKRVVT